MKILINAVFQGSAKSRERGAALWFMDYLDVYLQNHKKKRKGGGGLQPISLNDLFSPAKHSGEGMLQNRESRCKLCGPFPALCLPDQIPANESAPVGSGSAGNEWLKSALREFSGSNHFLPRVLCNTEGALGSSSYGAEGRTHLPLSWLLEPSSL